MVTNLLIIEHKTLFEINHNLENTLLIFNNILGYILHCPLWTLSENYEHWVPPNDHGHGIYQLHGKRVLQHQLLHVNKPWIIMIITNFEISSQKQPSRLP